MSVITIRVHKKHFDIAADSITVWGSTSRKDYTRAKLFQTNGLTIGGVGTCDGNQLMHHYAASHRPKSNAELDMSEYFLDFRQWARDKLKDEKYANSNSFIAIYLGKAFLIEELVATEIENYAAIGAGIDYALTALYLEHSAASAAGVACELSIYCEKPVISYSVPKQEATQ